MMSRHSAEIDPDEIFLDSKNLPDFDTDRFEGRIEAALSKRAVFFLGIVFFLFGFGYVGRLGVLQIFDGTAYAARSEDNRLRHTELVAERGAIYDRTGTLLAWNDPGRETIAAEGFGNIIGYLGLPTEKELAEHPTQNPNERIGRDGVERSYDVALRGKNGVRVEEVDARGDVVSESTQVLPRKGKDLRLSIDARVQEALFGYIKSLALERGFTGGGGGIIDVHTGELLALVTYPEYPVRELNNVRFVTEAELSDL